MGNYTLSNIGKIGSMLNKKGVGTKVSAEAIKPIAAALWESVLSFIDGNNLSWDHKSFNLRDSIGCGVYENGVLVHFFLSNPMGNEYKYFTYHKNRIKAKGSSRIRKSILEEPYVRPGVHIVFRCALAYGFFLEYGLGPNSYPNGDPGKKGYKWWSQELVPYIIKEFNRIAKG